MHAIGEDLALYNMLTDHPMLERLGMHGICQFIISFSHHPLHYTTSGKLQWLYVNNNEACDVVSKGFPC